MRGHIRRPEHVVGKKRPAERKNSAQNVRVKLIRARKQLDPFWLLQRLKVVRSLARSPVHGRPELAFAAVAAFFGEAPQLSRLRS